MKAVTDSELIAVTHSEAMAVTIGAKRRWRMDLDRSDRHPSKNSMKRSPIKFWEERNRRRRRRGGNPAPSDGFPSAVGNSLWEFSTGRHFHRVEETSASRFARSEATRMNSLSPRWSLLDRPSAARRVLILDGSSRRGYQPLARFSW